MTIAILAWGSLVWDKRDLPIQGEWQPGEPRDHRDGKTSGALWWWSRLGLAVLR